MTKLKIVNQDELKDWAKEIFKKNSFNMVDVSSKNETFRRALASGTIFVGEASVNELMVLEGHAWVYRDYSDEFQKFVQTKDLSPQNTALKAYQKLFKSMEFKRVSVTQSEFNLNFKESDNNILHELIKTSNEAYINMNM